MEAETELTQPQTRERLEPPRAGRGGRGFLRVVGGSGPLSTCRLQTLVFTIERENELLLSQATKTAVLCYYNPGEPVQIYIKKISFLKYVSSVARNFIISKFIYVV